VDWLKENGPHTPAQITKGINAESEKQRAPSTVKTTLARMVESGALRRDNGSYSIPERAPEKVTEQTKPLPTVTEKGRGIENSTVSTPFNGQPNVPKEPGLEIW
jgi:hypothetical protein